MSLSAPLEDKYTSAMRVCAAYRERVSAGNAEAIADFLRAHEPMRELLAAMLGVADTPVEAAPEDVDGAPPLRTLGPYRLQALLGSGGMGEVYSAVDERLGRTVALKLLRSTLHWPDALLRFRREAAAAAGLEHPCICKVYEAGEIDGVPFIAMQLVEGTTLAAAIAHAQDTPADDPSRPTSQTAIDLVLVRAEELARALHCAHAKGLVHRDVKPGNIMLTPEGLPMLMDFGLVRDTGADGAALTMSRAAVGTLPYMAPEQLEPRSDGPLDARADVYALGVTLFEWLTLTRPFTAASERELAQQILSGNAADPRALNRRISRDLAIVIGCAMDRDRSRRYASALDFAEDLSRILRRQPIRARPTGLALRALRLAQRRPVAATFVGTLAVGVVVATTFGVLATRNARLAEQSLDRYHLLSDVVMLRETKGKAKLLYPPFPEQAPALRAWLADEAERLARRLPAVQKARDDLLAGTGATTTRAGERGSDRFLLETLDQLVLDLTAFLGDDGEVADVRRRLREAESIRHRSVTEHQAEWDEAIAALAKSDGVAASPLYRGLALAPQTGLVPLGRDGASGLWEFAHLPSGEVPRRHPRTRALLLTEDSALVLVLLPGGTFTMGAQRHTPGRPDHDPLAASDETPHPVTLAPFFLGKHELTQGQWMRLSHGPNPSYFQPDGAHTPLKITLLHPVENVDWTGCDELMRQSGLCLPTEAQWEYGCRAGTTTPWWSGAERESLRLPRLVANLADRTAARAGADWPTLADWPEYDDGHPLHAPVGNLCPNPFGLCDVHGNVWEWCADWKLPYGNPVRAGDGLRLGDLRLGERSGIRTSRGGAFNTVARSSRSSTRNDGQPESRSSALGMRPCRTLER